MSPTWMSMDPALGGGNAVIVVQPTPRKLYIVDCRIDYGLERTEQQLEIITTLARRYNPSLLIIEADGMQKAIGKDDRLQATGALLGFQIQAHLTRGVKLHAEYHVAAMNQSFVAQQISIPYADEESRNRMEPLLHQLRQWRPDIPAKKLRQDAVMALWFVWRHWMKVNKAQNEVPRMSPRPSWVRNMKRVVA